MRHFSYPDSLFHDPLYSPKCSLMEKFLFDKESLPLDEAQAQELSDFFLKRGEVRLLQGDLAGMRDFDLATKLNPRSSKLFYDIGLSYFEFGNKKGKERHLLKACRAFKSSVQLTPAFFDAYLAWGNCLYLLGKSTHEHHYFQKAKEKYEKALIYKESQDLDTVAHAHWDLALVWKELGLQSGEALDLRVSIDNFEKAAELNEKLPIDFWQDFGNTSILLAQQLNDPMLYQKGVNCLKNAVSLSLSSSECWFALGKALADLYFQTLDDDAFMQANECLSTSAQISSHNPALYHSWAALLSYSGRLTKDRKKLCSAIDKCKQGLLLNEAPQQLLLLWAESLSTLGTLSEDLAQIYEAQNKLTEALALYDDMPELWHAYGTTLEALATYFDDLDLYFQAIEKFQTGLSLDRTSDALWHGMARVYRLCGTRLDTVEDLELAAKFYCKALDFNPCALYHLEYAMTLTKLAESKDEVSLVEEAVIHFETAFNYQKNSIYLHPDWYFEYAEALDLYADYHESTEHYQKSLEILCHVLMVDPEFPKIHHRLALVYSHFADHTLDTENFLRAIHHYRLASKHEPEDDAILLDWGVTAINFAEHLGLTLDGELYYQMAQSKLTESAKLGNMHAYYQLGCLFSILKDNDRAMHFIEKAYTHDALPPLDHMQADEWLDGLREQESFVKLISLIETHLRNTSE